MIFKLFRGWVRWLGLFLLLFPLSVKAQTTPLSDLDALRYIASQPDLIAAFGADAAKGRSHYETWGIKEGRKITFEPLNYTASHPDLIAAFGIDEIKAVTHYIQWGFKEGRLITFDPASYLALHADLRQAYGTDLKAAASHYIRFGYAEGRATQGAPIFQSSASSLTFDNQLASSTKSLTITNAGTVSLTVTSIALAGNDATRFTQKNNCSSLAAASSCSVDITYTPQGSGESSASLRIITNASGSPHIIPLFGKLIPLSDLDALRYIASQPDLIAAFGADAAKGRSHYETWGIKEGRKITFVPLNYIASHPDLMAAFGFDEAKAVTHYIQWGFKEGRTVTFDPGVYLALHADLRAAFGMDLAAAARHYIQWGYKEGRATAGTLAIRLSSATLAFANQVINTSSATQKITVSNSGSVPLSVNAVSVTGSEAAEFSQSSDCSTVAVGASCAINVTFTPTSVGSKTASISITHNASGSPTSVALSGAGVIAASTASVISVNPTSLSFSQTVNTTSTAQAVTVSNTGNTVLTISGVNLTGTDVNQFSQTNNCTSVTAGSSCTINITFRPTSTGSKTASVSITHNAGGSPTAVGLSGTATPAATTTQPTVSLSTSIVTFGNQVVDTQSAAQTITVRNSGTASLVVTSISVTDITQFPGTQNCTAASIAPNEACLISVSFKPTSAGSKSATVSINHNAAGSPTTVSLVGSAVSAASPSVSVSPSGLTFASQNTNSTSVAQIVTLRNTGTAIATISNISLGGANAAEFVQTNNCSSVAAGASCTVNVTFRPSTSGSKSASLSIAHNGSGSPIVVALSGTATTPATTNASPGGLWTGRDSVTGDPIVGLISEDGRFQFVVFDGAPYTQYWGRVTTSGNSISSSNILVAYGDTYLGTASFTNGTIVSRQSIRVSGNFTPAPGCSVLVCGFSSSRAIALGFDSVYLQGGSLSRIVGNWVDTETLDVINISSTGVVFSQSPFTGCVVNGVASTIDTVYNAYSVSYSYSNCRGTFTYLNGTTSSGLAFVDTSVSPNRAYFAGQFRSPTGAITYTTYGEAFKR